MERIPNGKYTKEFREEAVKIVTINTIKGETVVRARHLARQQGKP